MTDANREATTAHDVTEAPLGQPAALALLCAGVAASIVLVTLPIFVSGMAAQVGGTDRDVGWLASADMAGSVVAALCILRSIHRIDWRRIGYLALAIVVAGNLASIAPHGLAALLAARAVAGFGNGLVLCMAFVGLCRSANPERFFGIYTFAQLSLQALALSLLPRLLASSGVAGAYALFAATAVASTLLVARFPSSPMVRPATGTHSGQRLRPALAIAAQTIYFLAPAAIWGYFERIGQGFALTLAEVGHALSVASLIGIAGAVTVACAGASFGRWRPMIVGTAVSIASMVLLMDGSGSLRYIVAAGLFNFAWNFTFPYQMGLLSTLDTTGSIAVPSLVAQLLGLSLGPALASLLLSGRGYDGVLWACIGCYLASVLLFWVSAGTLGAATVRQQPT